MYENNFEVYLFTNISQKLTDKIPYVIKYDSK